MINSHPSLSTISAQNRSISRPISSQILTRFGAVSRSLPDAEKRENVNPAQKRRFIKPNKTGDPDAWYFLAAIGEATSGQVAIAQLKRRKGCLNATTTQDIKMTFQTALILLGFAALAAVLLIGLGFHRAGKAIDVLRCAREEDRK